MTAKRKRKAGQTEMILMKNGEFGIYFNTFPLGSFPSVLLVVKLRIFTSDVYRASAPDVAFPQETGSPAS
jgi:hypothetical protein